MNRIRRIGYTLSAILLLLTSAFLFVAAIAILRINVLLVEADRKLTNKELVSVENFFDNRWNRNVIKLFGEAENFALRRAYVLLYKGDIQQAEAILLELAKSEDKKLASLALTLLGKTTVQLAIEKQDSELFELVRERFAKAIVLDPENEDAKFNLELLNKTLTRNLITQSKSYDKQKESQQGELPLDELPGEESGTPEDYSDY